jgi:hypothetical protein
MQAVEDQRGREIFFSAKMKEREGTEGGEVTRILLDGRLEVCSIEKERNCIRVWYSSQGFMLCSIKEYGQMCQ